MTDYSDRIFAVHGKPIGIVEAGPHTIGINGGGRKVFGLLDGRRLTESKSSKEFLEKAAPVLAMIMSNLIQKDEAIRVSAKRKDSSLLNQVLDSIRKEKEKAEVFVLEIKPDEITENKPKEIKASNRDEILSSMIRYADDLGKFEEAVKETHHMAEILLKTNLPMTMWGGREVANVLSSVKSDLEEMSPYVKRFEYLKESSVKGSEYIAQALRKNLDPSTLMKIGVGKVKGKMTENFYEMKGTMSRLAQVLHRLFNADRLFKKHTGYPTTWFFDSSIYYDFLYGFENIISNLIRSAMIEKGTIEPLFVWFQSTRSCAT